MTEVSTVTAMALATTGLYLDDGEEVVTVSKDGSFDGDGNDSGDNGLDLGQHRRGRDGGQRRKFLTATATVTVMATRVLFLVDGDKVVTAGNDRFFDGDGDLRWRRRACLWTMATRL